MLFKDYSSQSCSHKRDIQTFTKAVSTRASFTVGLLAQTRLCKLACTCGRKACIPCKSISAACKTVDMSEIIACKLYRTVKLEPCGQASCLCLQSASRSHPSRMSDTPSYSKHQDLNRNWSLHVLTWNVWTRILFYPICTTYTAQVNLR